MHNTIIQCEKWLSDEVSKAGAKGIILGLSGGIDSSVLAAL
ncbi:MAG: NAD(+) synthetase, partial [Synergistaceae bacterium]|nr:NAD(+) synthetase [Synergistaceae bacterium]